jgi:hypothetical protein
MKITERYIKAKAQQALKSLIQAKANYVKGSAMNQAAMMEAKKEQRQVTILSLKGVANFKVELDYQNSLQTEIVRLNRIIH